MKIQERNHLAHVVRPALFNERQQAILLKALKDPATRFTYESHAQAHGITLATARTDLLSLESKGFVRGNRVGRRFEFLAVADFEKRLNKLAGKSKTKGS